MSNSISRKNKKAVETTNVSMKAMEARLLEEDQKLYYTLNEFKEKMDSHEKESKMFMDKSNQDIHTIEKQIEFLQLTVLENEKNANRGLLLANKEISSLNEKFSSFTKKVENFEAATIGRGPRASLPIMITSKPFHKEEHHAEEHQSPDPVDAAYRTAMIENELKSYRFKMELELKFLRNELYKAVKDEIKPFE